MTAHLFYFFKVGTEECTIHSEESSNAAAAAVRIRNLAV